MNFKRNWIFYLLMILNFYAFPFLITDTGSGMLFLLFVMPVICFIISLIYGIKNGMKLFFPLITAVLFVPSVFIFYNSSAAIYIVIFGIVSLIGCLIGAPFSKHKKGS